MAFLHQLLDPDKLSKLSVKQRDALTSKLEAEVAALSGGNAIKRKDLESRLEPSLEKMLKTRKN